MYNRIASVMLVSAIGLGIGLLLRRQPSGQQPRAVSDWEDEGGAVPVDEELTATQTTPAAAG